MKSIFLFAALLLLGHALYAQNSSRLTVRNTTPCTMYYRVVVSPPVTPGATSCSAGGVSALLSIAPGTFISYTATSLPGISTPPGADRVILGGIVCSGPSGCDTPALNVSSYGCLGWPNSVIANVNGAGCTICIQTIATWNFSGQNTLLFN